MSKRSYLFLQGVCSPFFAQLADRLKTDGHHVAKINFNGGDSAYWCPRPALGFRGGVEDLPEFLDAHYRRLGITDQVLFGDRRPVHRPAVERAEHYGIRTHVFEEGYFRPHWVTLEREGVNGHSLLPRDPDWFREVGKRWVGGMDIVPFDSPFWLRAAHDVAYHSASAINPFFFPGYRTHSPVNAVVEYAGYACRFARLPFHRRKDDLRLKTLIERSAAFFLLPLQLNSDAQIRDHSRFNGMEEVIGFVVESFVRHAPSNAKLLIKNHPLDMGLVDYRKIINRLSERFEVPERLVYLETGNLDLILRNTLGVVTVNSTVGLSSLAHGRPTITLSDPIYNLPGLCFQGCLDDFWAALAKPDKELFRYFRNTVIHTTQINGGFYCPQGIALAVDNSCRFLEPELSPLEELL